MGRPNPVLEIAVCGSWMTQPAVLWMIETGHRVMPYPGPLNPDLILHPAAGWHAALFEARTNKAGETKYPYLEARLKKARAYRQSKCGGTSTSAPSTG